MLQLFYYAIERVNQFSLQHFLSIVPSASSYVDTIPQVGLYSFLGISSKTYFFHERILLEFRASVINNWI